MKRSPLKTFLTEPQKQLIIKAGYEVLKEKLVYVKAGHHARKTLLLGCRFGHKFRTTWRSFTHGTRCSTCKNQKPKIDVQRISKQLKKRGHILLSTEYKTQFTKLEVLCGASHRYQTNWKRLQVGHGCPKCGRISSNEKLQGTKWNGVRKHGHMFIQESLAVGGYSLLSVYKNTKAAIRVRCPEGHEYQTNWANFNSGSRCAKCKKNAKWTIEEVKHIAAGLNHTLISESYINSQSPLVFLCPEGHEYQTNWKSLYNDSNGCSVCVGNEKIGINRVQAQMEKFGYKLLSTEYINHTSYLQVRCPDGHDFETKWLNIRDFGPSCPTCPNSRAEAEIAGFLESIGVVDVETNCKNAISPYEIDLFIKRLNVGIEYGGLHWHSDEIRPNKLYHQNKWQMAKDAGIQLLTIFEDEWLSQRSLIERQIKNLVFGVKKPLDLGRYVHDRRFPLMTSSTLKKVGELPPKFWFVKGQKRYNSQQNKDKRIYDCGYTRF